MALTSRQRRSVADFMAFVERPEHAAKRFELVDGEIVEVPSNPFASVIAARIITLIGMHLLQNQLQGYVSGEGGGYLIDGQVLAPDVAYVRTLPTKSGFEETPPSLAVEVISDPRSNAEQTDLRRKLVHYLRAGVLVWVVDYVAQRVEVHAPEKQVLLFDTGDKLSGADVLPGFELTVKDIFPVEDDTAST